MKQKIYIFGLVTALIIITGTTFKVNHFPGAGILLTIGLSTLVLIFLPAALINNYRMEGSRQNLSLYIVTWLTCFVVFAAMLFKMQHWPLAGILITLALPFPYIVFLPVFLAVTSKNKNFNIYNTVFVLLLLALNSVFSALLSLNVSKATIDDSYNISRNYTRLEEVMKQLPERHQLSSVNLKIDEVLKIVNQYKDLILNQEGLSGEQWNNNPGNLWRPESGRIAANALFNENEPFPGEKLQTGLKNLILEFEKSPGYESLARSAPLILDYNEAGYGGDPWARQVFINSPLSWALIYLDGLETNLYMMKESFPEMN